MALMLMVSGLSIGVMKMVFICSLRLDRYGR